MTPEEYLSRVHPDDRDAMREALAGSLSGRVPPPSDYRVILPTGAIHWMHTHADVTLGEDGTLERLTGYSQDITELKAHEERRDRALAELAEQRQLLDRVARGEAMERTLNTLCTTVERHYPGTRCTVLLVDAAEGVLRPAAGPSISSTFKEALDGLPIEVGAGACGTAAARKETVTVEDAQVDSLTTAFSDLATREEVRSVWSYPLLNTVGDVIGTFAVYRGTPHKPDDDEIAIVAAFADLAAVAIERKLTEDALTTAAEVDPLTGLPNRRWFLDRLGEHIAEPGSDTAVLFTDLDRFSWINDSLGHEAGDRVLLELGQRLATVLDGRATLARFGGDEFTLFVPHVDRDELAEVLALVRSAVEQPFVIGEREFLLTNSVGIALSDDITDAYRLIRNAHVAMHAAKKEGHGDGTMFDAVFHERALARVTLEAELRRAIERGELEVYYQPVLNLDTGTWAGAEALVRWPHPEQGLIRPDQFIPLAEETGLIVPLGRAVLDQAIAQVGAWASRGFLPYVSINASVVQLTTSGFADDVKAALDRHGVPPELIRIEVTESAVMEQLDSARETLDAITALGVRIMIDDFGTGYSSIARLSDLPVAGIKIDQRFTAGAGTDPRATHVLSAITDLGHALDLRVLAEGVETEEALATVAAVGCNYAQGYHLGRPAPAEGLEAILRQPRG
jgi:diguanylate cyclase (GGDEF)-like protein